MIHTLNKNIFLIKFLEKCISVPEFEPRTLEYELLFSKCLQLDRAFESNLVHVELFLSFDY